MDYINEIYKYLNKKFVKVIEGAEDWSTAVRASMKILVDNGCVEERYVDGAIETCRNMGPYIAIAPGIAIPHARPEDGAKEVCLCFLIVRNGVYFGSENDPVHLLIGFSSPDRVAHLALIKELAGLLINYGPRILDLAKSSIDESYFINGVLNMLALNNT
ncbi:MAG: PTS sugar transporter subunit IIA [Sulfolobales archaeon]|nr:PTS sugar transporter subunit IIA [Sulfolobales archaeon]